MPRVLVGLYVLAVLAPYLSMYVVRHADHWPIFRCLRAVMRLLVVLLLPVALCRSGNTGLIWILIYCST